jgi:hypothetical protein
LERHLQPSRVTQVFRAEEDVGGKASPDAKDWPWLRPDVGGRESEEVEDKGRLLLDSIIRTSEQNSRAKQRLREKQTELDAGENMAPEMINPGLDGLERQFHSSCGVTSNEGGSRTRSWSETASGQTLEPLDFSFEDEDDGSNRQVLFGRDHDVGDDDEEALGNSIHQLNHSAVPSSSDMDNFRQSLDSATSMVFHRRTGLPLTSSPAPLRKGKANFDYDSSINSPHDIKR